MFAECNCWTLKFKNSAGIGENSTLLTKNAITSFLVYLLIIPSVGLKRRKRAARFGAHVAPRLNNTIAFASPLIHKQILASVKFSYSIIKIILRHLMNWNPSEWIVIIITPVGFWSDGALDRSGSDVRRGRHVRTTPANSLQKRGGLLTSVQNILFTIPRDF